MKAKKDLNTKHSLLEYLPDDHSVWLVFDMSNGHKGSYRYVWWFDSKREAKEHIKGQGKKDGAELSEPMKFRWEGK